MRFRAGLLLAIFALSFMSVQAQEVTETQTPIATETAMPNTTETLTPDATIEATAEANESSGEATETSLEELTSGTEQFVGQRVSFEGVIESLANVKILVVGEGAVIDDDRVLVVNQTNEEFDLSFSEGARVYVTGVFQPSIQAQMDNAVTARDSAVTPLPDGATAEADVDAPDVPDLNETPATPSLTQQPDMDVTIEATQETQTDLESEIFSLQSLLDETQLEQYRNYTIVELTSLSDLTLVVALGEISGNADQYYDRSLMVQGTVEKLVSDNAFVLNEGGLLNNNRLLVMDAAGIAGLTEGQNVRVFGTVKPYDVPTLEQDLGLTLDQTVFADYQDYTVVEANRIVPVP